MAYLQAFSHIVDDWFINRCNYDSICGSFKTLTISACSTLESGYLEEDGAFQCSAKYKFEYTQTSTDDSLESVCSECTGNKPVASEFS